MCDRIKMHGMNNMKFIKIQFLPRCKHLQPSLQRPVSKFCIKNVNFFKEYGLLWCYAVSLGEFPTFRRKIVPPNLSIKFYPWRCRRYISSKRLESLTQKYNVISHKTWILKNTTVRASNLALGAYSRNLTNTWIHFADKVNNLWMLKHVVYKFTTEILRFTISITLISCTSIVLQ